MTDSRDPRPVVSRDLYGAKSESYFGHARKDILPLLPDFADTVLEVGCGSGATLRWLKATGRCRRTVGVELVSSAAARAAEHLDLVIEAGVEGEILPIDRGSIDMLMLLDVLEHLVDPWKSLGRLVPLLKPGATVIVSVPNINHVTALMPLVLGGRFEYTSEGILDRSHLRFFVRESAERMLRDAGLTVQRVAANGLAPGTKGGLANLMTLGLFRRFFVEQYLFRATNLGPPTP